MIENIKMLAALILCIAAIFITGFICGYVHVITHAEAYIGNDENLLILMVDDHQYEYFVRSAPDVR